MGYLSALGYALYGIVHATVMCNLKLSSLSVAFVLSAYWRRRRGDTDTDSASDTAVTAPSRVNKGVMRS